MTDQTTLNRTGKTKMTGLMVKLLPSNDAEGRVFGPDIIAICLADAQLTNARSMALVGNSEAGACELLFFLFEA